MSGDGGHLGGGAKWIIANFRNIYLWIYPPAHAAHAKVVPTPPLGECVIISKMVEAPS